MALGTIFIWENSSETCWTFVAGAALFNPTSGISVVDLPSATTSIYASFLPGSSHFQPYGPGYSPGFLGRSIQFVPDPNLITTLAPPMKLSLSKAPMYTHFRPGQGGIHSTAEFAMPGSASVTATAPLSRP
ncbi:hypothetical protein C8R47DRAFT_1080058 [Mycena vitilis]|nr:hypothetical protein C8R47DRAFT_1080058 [Mycena vitilis]